MVIFLRSSIKFNLNRKIILSNFSMQIAQFQLERSTNREHTEINFTMINVAIAKRKQPHVMCYVTHSR